jgi:orotate phosphoribosyltransferase
LTTRLFIGIICAVKPSGLITILRGGGDAMTDKKFGEQEILERVSRALTTGHFVYTSGKHGRAYINKSAIYAREETVKLLCSSIAYLFLFDHVEVVVGPETGGNNSNVLSKWTAYYLAERCHRTVISVSAKMVGDRFVIKKESEGLISGKNVLVVDDVVTTGGTIRKIVETVRSLGGFVAKAAALCRRTDVAEIDLGSPPPALYALTTMKLDSWDADQCPLCAKGVPVNTDLGHGTEFLRQARS